MSDPDDAEEEAAPLYPVPMTDLISGRQCVSNAIVSTGPDVCLTPVGSSLVPVAYTSVAFAGESTRVSPSVLDNENPDFHLNSRMCISTGHEPGVGAGVAVPGYQGEAFVRTASPTVFTDGWASTRHSDPAWINAAGTGAVEPQFERTSYYDQIVARIQNREQAESLDMCYATDLEANMPSRDVEPGTNECVETGNGAALLLTGTSAPPEVDYRRRPGETQDEYFERVGPLIRERPRGVDALQGKISELEGIADAITSDPDFWAWQQGIPPELFHNPLGTEGVTLNELNSRTANGDPASMQGLMPMLSPWDFVAADGNVYSAPPGPAILGSRPSYAKGELAILDEQYRRWREANGDPVGEDYRLSTVIPWLRSELGIRPGMAIEQGPVRVGEPPGRLLGPGEQPRFTQTTASPTFQNGPFAGRTIGDVAAGLRNGTISPSQLPLDVVVRNGQPLSLNTRSLLALQRAGIDPSRYVIRNVTGNQFFERLLTERLGRNGLTALGTRTLRITGMGRGISSLR
ncbi:MAG: DUF4150 domain-containing protein [Sandaracinaceae bacterium]